MSIVQPFPPLDASTEAALRASIERFGVLVPVIRNQHGQILDGNHRARIAGELGIDFPVEMHETADDWEAREIARTVNADRRHLSVEQRRANVFALREEGHSQNAIANALGVSQSTIRNDLAEPSTPTKLPDRITGLDGKSRPAKREVSTERRTPLGRRSNTEPFTADNKRRVAIATGQRDRLIEGLSQINGICRGLNDLDYGMTAAVLSKDELRGWAAKAKAHARALRGVEAKLMEVSNAL